MPADGVGFAMTADDPSPRPAEGGSASVDLTFAATTFAVRTGLTQLAAMPLLASLGPEDRGTAELLLAEALNNVVEHAYARWPGDITLHLARAGGHISVVIRDQGLPMPGNTPPQGALPRLDAPESLPEGGFGWFLIRSLAKDLTYRRLGAVNELHFRIPVDNWEA